MVLFSYIATLHDRSNWKRSVMSCLAVTHASKVKHLSSYRPSNVAISPHHSYSYRSGMSRATGRKISEIKRNELFID
jgi:hypothetical protein